MLLVYLDLALQLMSVNIIGSGVPCVCLVCVGAYEVDATSAMQAGYFHRMMHEVLSVLHAIARCQCCA